MKSGSKEVCSPEVVVRANLLALNIQNQIESGTIHHHFPDAAFEANNLTVYQDRWGGDHRIIESDLPWFSGLYGQDFPIATKMINTLLNEGKQLPLETFFAHIAVRREEGRHNPKDKNRQDQQVVEVFKKCLQYWYLDLKREQGLNGEYKYRVDLGYLFNPLSRG